MKEYDIKITETLERTVTVKAESREDAKQMVEADWGQSKYILDSEDFAGVDFDIQEERSLNLDKINVLLVEPGQYPKEVQIGRELKDMQAIVKGEIEATYPFDDEVAIVLNSEGKIYGMSWNRAIRTESGEVSDIYAGPFLVVGLTEDDFGSLSPELMKKYEGIFHQPEMFVKLGKGFMVLPIPDESVKSKEIESKEKKLPKIGER